MTASRLLGFGLFAVLLAALVRAEGPPAAPRQALFEGRPLRDWIADLKDPDALVREEAIEVLGQAGAEAHAAVPQLEKMLTDRSPGVRVRVVLALWHIDGRKKDVARALADCLKEDEGPISRTQALVYLGQLGADAAPAVDAILGLIDTTDFVLRAQVISTFQQLGDTAAPAIVKALGSKKNNVRRQAVNFLTQHFGPPLPGTLAALTPLLKDKDTQLRTETATLLWRNGRQTEAVVAVLVEAIRSPNQNLRYQVANVVFQGTSVPKVALPLFKAALASTDQYVRVRAAQGMWGLEKKAADVLPIYLKALEDNNVAVWSSAAAGIAQIGPEARAAIPALIKRLLATTRGFYNLELSNALAAIGPDAIAPLTKAMKTPGLNATTRSQIVSIFGRMGPKAAPALVPLLESTDKRLRNTVCAALGNMGSQAKAAVPALVKLLAIKDSNLQKTVVRTLGRIGPAAREALEPLDKLTHSTDPATRAAAFSVLGLISHDPRDLLPRALAALEDRDDTVQLSGLELLAQADPRHPKLIPATLALLDKPTLRMRVFVFLPRLGPAGSAAVPTLVDLLNSKDLSVRYQVLNALGQMGPAAREAVPALVETLKDSNRQVRSNALLALHNLGPTAREAVPALIRILKDPDANLRQQALSALGNVGPGARRAVPTMLPFLKDNNVNVRRTVVSALGQIGPGAHAAVPGVLDLLEDRDTSVQYAVLNTLRMIKDAKDGKRIAARLTTLLEKRKTVNFWIVAQLLGDLGRDGSAAIPLLLVELKKPKSPYRLPVAEALARIDPARVRKEVVPVLQELLHAGTLNLPVAASLERIDPGNKEAVAVFHQALKDKNANNRSYAASLLGMRGSDAKWATSALRKALADETSQVRIAAAAALWQIRKDTKTTLAVLLKELKEAEPSYLRGTAAFRLGDMGEAARPAVSALLEAWRGGDVNMRYQALHALNRIDPHAVTRAGSPPARNPKSPPKSR
jgi:HEAT repeat protein